MISESECRKILNSEGDKIYSPDEILAIRDLLYKFAIIDLEKYKNEL